MQIYKVGGVVRDRLLGLDLKNSDSDWVVVDGTHQDMINLGYKIVGNRFPVYINNKTKEEYALARREKKFGFGYNGFEFETEKISLIEDLSRRDLTINSMAEDENGNLIDPFNGLTDLNLRILRHTTDAFREDPLRVLRVARFKATLPFNFTIAQETINLMIEIVKSGELKTISRERIKLELEKTIKKGSIVIFFQVLNEVNAINELFNYIPQNYYFNLIDIHKLDFSEFIAILSLKVEPEILKENLALPNLNIKFANLFKNIYILLDSFNKTNIYLFFKKVNDKELLLKALKLLKKLDMNKGIEDIEIFMKNEFERYLNIKQSVWNDKNIDFSQKEEIIIDRFVDDSDKSQNIHYLSFDKIKKSYLYS